jgi:hypothetical protein
MAEIHDQFDTILILDFGSQVQYDSRGFFVSKYLCRLQYSHLITRRCREHNVYAELMPCTTKMQDINFKPKGLHEIYLVHQLNWMPFSSGIILSGSPYSVYDSVSPHVDPTIFDLGVPILGICYGLQAWFQTILSCSRCLPLPEGNCMESRRGGYQVWPSRIWTGRHYHQQVWERICRCLAGRIRW